MTPNDSNTPNSKPWHATPTDDVLSALAVDEAGLSSDEADRRLTEYGTNDIHEADRTSVLNLLLSQFRNPLIYLLIVAALLSLSTGFIPGGEPSYAEAVFITLIIGANGVFGFVQDYQATRSIEALRELASPDATVRRDGRKQSIEAEEVVPGDIVYLSQELEFHNSVRIDDRLTAECEVIEDLGNDQYRFQTPVLKDDEAVINGEAVILINEPPEDKE